MNYSNTYEAKRPCIITIDEFQQIKNYPEKNVEALLRSYIQKMRNCRFVFAGSERTEMLRMFNKKQRHFTIAPAQLIYLPYRLRSILTLQFVFLGNSKKKSLRIQLGKFIV